MYRCTLYPAGVLYTPRRPLPYFTRYQYFSPHTAAAAHLTLLEATLQFAPATWCGYTPCAVLPGAHTPPKVRAHSAALGKFTRVLIIVDAAELSFSTIRNIGTSLRPSHVSPSLGRTSCSALRRSIYETTTLSSLPTSRVRALSLSLVCSLTCARTVQASSRPLVGWAWPTSQRRPLK